MLAIEAKQKKTSEPEQGSQKVDVKRPLKQTCVSSDESSEDDPEPKRVKREGFSAILNGLHRRDNCRAKEEIQKITDDALESLRKIQASEKEKIKQTYSQILAKEGLRLLE
jgi:hypothetical protein